MNLRLKRYIDSIVKQAVRKRFYMDGLWESIIDKIKGITQTIGSTDLAQYGSEAKRASKRISEQLTSVIKPLSGIRERIPVPVGQGFWPAGWSNANVYREVKVGMDDILTKIVNAAKTLSAKEQDFKAHGGEDFYNSLRGLIGGLTERLAKAKAEMPSPNNLSSSRNTKFVKSESERAAEKELQKRKKEWKPTVKVRKK